MPFQTSDVIVEASSFHFPLFFVCRDHIVFMYSFGESNLIIIFSDDVDLILLVHLFFYNDLVVQAYMALILHLRFSLLTSKSN